MPPDRRGANYPPRFHLAASNYITIIQTLPQGCGMPSTTLRFHKVASRNITIIQTLPEAGGVPITPWRFHKVASNNITEIQTLPKGCGVQITPLRFHKVASNKIRMIPNSNRHYLRAVGCQLPPSAFTKSLPTISQ